MTSIAQVFGAGGFTAIDVPIIQPADPFLNLSGEDIRRRIYVFADPYGKELCLRPDLTIPACLHYLTDAGDASERRYAYDGLAFRCQEPGSDKPNEFSQSGIELIGAPSGPAADAEVFALTLRACEQAGLKDFDIATGDLGLFAAYIEALDIPAHWRARLRRSFWQPSRFGAILQSLSENREASAGAVALLGKLDEDSALETVSGLLDIAGLDTVPGRSVESVTRRLMNKARDASAEPVSPAIIASIEEYLKITGTPSEALASIRALASSHGITIDKTLSEAEDRMQRIETAAVGRAVTFATEFGRSFEYYTGFVFELTSGTQAIAGGGRYDDLLNRLGAEGRVPAVGAMIRNDRLATAISRREGNAS
jgi:ATP phosphoribosyltransferase regulatory subunit